MVAYKATTARPERRDGNHSRKEEEGMPYGRWATIAEAAQHYGISRQSVHKAIRKGGFAGARMVEMPRGAVWLLPLPLTRRTLRNGRPPKLAENERGE